MNTEKTEDPKWIRRIYKYLNTCWQYHGPCQHVNFQSWYDEQEKQWHIKAAPVFQEVYGGLQDGQKIWTGFLFDVMEFSRKPGVWVEETAVASYCNGCTDHPKMMSKCRYKGKSFLLHVYLEPVAETQVVEVLDVIKQEVREFEPVVATENGTDKK